MNIVRSKWWSVHTHSRFSTNDALPPVEDLVARAAGLGQKAMGLTDHGNMAGAVELYQACAKHGIKPFPGTELYFVPDIAQHRADYASKDTKATRYHLGVVAYDAKGYENLVKLNTISHQQHFHKPLVDFTTLAQLAEDGCTEGLAVLTGCYFGYAAQTLVLDGEGPCEQFVATLAEWFPGSTYVELQNHNIDHGDGWNDNILADALLRVADRLGLPCITTQDSHYLQPEDKADHESLKRLIAFGPESDDAVFPGDGFHFGTDRWIRDHHSDARYDRGIEGLDHLLARHGLSIPVLDSYSYSIPRVVSEPQQAMESRCVTELDKKFGTQARGYQKYRHQLEEELSVIGDADMAGYMLLCAMVTDYMKEENIVFQTRGSAAGSLVCWLLGITQVDPLKWDLRFERFLSRDRTKPPDIDLDIAHESRQGVIDWLNTKFSAHQIGTWAKYGMAEEKNEADEDSGSLLKRYFSRQKYQDQPIKEISEIPREDMATLYRLSERELYSGMGKNAAGVVITSTKAEFERLVPLAHSNSGPMVSQYNKNDVESLGLVKLDVLGLKTLTVLNQCAKALDLDLDEIPLNDKQVYAFMRTGNTEGVFQLEGWTSKKGIKRLRPTKIHDVIAAMALFRPAIMKSGATEAFMDRKNGKEEVPLRHEILNVATKDTYGVLLYQEQVIDMLRALDMGEEDLNAFLGAVKASNKNVGGAGLVIASYQDWLERKMKEKGFNDDDRKFVDEAITGFAGYSFNRAHATVYGITAYRCAWLVVHRELHFHAALLAVAAGDKSKEPGYVAATRRRGLRISQPDINASGRTYRVDTRTNSIRRGLISIKGVGDVCASFIESEQPYRSIRDLLERTPASKVNGRKGYEGDVNEFTGHLGALRDGGALESLQE